jgi:hypothetical protein
MKYQVEAKPIIWICKGPRIRKWRHIVTVRTRLWYDARNIACRLFARIYNRPIEPGEISCYKKLLPVLPV